MGAEVEEGCIVQCLISLNKHGKEPEECRQAIAGRPVPRRFRMGHAAGELNIE